jgi:hypothetical protein
VDQRIRELRGRQLGQKILEPGVGRKLADTMQHLLPCLARAVGERGYEEVAYLKHGGAGDFQDLAHHGVLPYRLAGSKDVVEEHTLEVVLRHALDFGTRAVDDHLLQRFNFVVDVNTHVPAMVPEWDSFCPPQSGPHPAAECPREPDIAVA